MKTAQSIEEQEERKQARGDPAKNNGKDPKHRAQNSNPVSKEARIARLAPFRFQPGKSGNPGGRPHVDLAAEMARACFEENWDAYKAAFNKSMMKGNAYCFKELADRAYGKLKEKHEIEVGPYRDLTDEQLEKRVVELEQELGVAPTLLPPADEKPN